jgi:integrase
VASIDRRPNGEYRARWREYPGGPQKTRQFRRKVDAQRFLDVIRGDLARGSYIDPDAGRILFKEYAEEWRAAQVHRRGTAAATESYLRLHAYPKLGNRPIAAIRRSEIQGWVKDRSEVLAPGTVELVYRWVATIFKAAVGDRINASSPCVRIALPKRPPTEVEPLSVEAVDALAAAMPARYRALIVFAPGTGLRQGECFGLTVDRVDFLRKQVRVDQQVTHAAGGVPQFGPLKTQGSYRTVPLPEVVTGALAAHLSEFGEGPQRLVFTNSRGGRCDEARSTRYGTAPPMTCSPPARRSTTSATSTRRCSSPTAAR